MSKEFVHDTENSRYLLKINDQIASVVEYNDNGSVRAFNRTFTPPTFRGQGLAAEIVKFAVDEVESEDPAMKIQPTCWYVEKWFQENPDRQNMMA